MRLNFLGSKRLNASEEDPGTLVEDIVNPPKYDTRNRQPRKFNEEIKSKVINYIGENEKKMGICFQFIDKFVLNRCFYNKKM